MNTQHHSNKVETYPSLLRHSIKECSDRGLYFASKWSAEQLTGLSSSLATTHSRIPFLPLIPEDCEIHSDLNGNSTIPPLSLGLHPEHDVYLLAKTYFDLKEFKRCAWVLQECQAPLHLFLWGYAMYLDGEKQLHDTLGPVLGDTDTHQSTNLALPIILEKLNMMNELHPITASDPWLLYLKALILYKARSMNAAFEVLMKSVVMYPLNWSAWTLLTQFMHSEAM
ncbi:Anaphase-promoting complex subunit 23, partial [Coelomomyces lativittatus]